MQFGELRHVYSQIKEQKPSEQGRKKTFPTPIYAENSVLFQRARASILKNRQNIQKVVRKYSKSRQKVGKMEKKKHPKNRMRYAKNMQKVDKKPRGNPE